MSLSANDIIERAMVKARIIAPGESIPASKIVQVYAELNGMLESWALEKLMVVADVLESFALVVGQAEYTYGTGGDFDSVRPIEIKDESFIRSGGVDYPVPLLTLDVYRRRILKTTRARPIMMAYNPEYPLGKVFFWPTPSAIDSIHLRVAKTLTGFPDRTTAVNLETGYSRAIISNLAIEISPNFGKKVSKELAFLAEQAKRSIKSANSIPIKPSTCPDLRSVAGGGRVGNILSDPWG
jgi:hypothetical protein